MMLAGKFRQVIGRLVLAGDFWQVTFWQVTFWQVTFWQVTFGR
jgi:hypothetical protein